jgi:hypothetical protein
MRSRRQDVCGIMVSSISSHCAGSGTLVWRTSHFLPFFFEPADYWLVWLG